jgi:tetratricopeptide (TPR) repeat protein
LCFQKEAEFLPSVQIITSSSRLAHALAIMALIFLSFPGHAAEKSKGDAKQMKKQLEQAREAQKSSNYEGALESYRAAAEEADKFRPSDSTSWLVWAEAGDFMLRLHLYDEAALQFKKGAEAITGLRKEDRFRKAIFLGQLGACYRFSDQNQMAEKLLIQSRDLIIDSYGPNEAQLAPVLFSLGIVYLQEKRLSEAEEALKRALKLAETETVVPFVDGQSFGHRVYKPNPMQAGEAQSSLGFLYRQQKNYAEAEKYLEKALKTAELGYGKANPNVAPRLRNLAVLYGEMGKPQEQEQALNREIAIEEKAPGSMLDCASTSLLLAQLYSGAQRSADLQKLFERLIEQNQKHAPDHDYLPGIVQKLATEEKDWPRLKGTFDVAVAAAEKRYNPKAKMGLLLAAMMQAAATHGQPAEAEKYGLAQLDVLEKSGAPPSQMVGALQEMSEFYIQQSRPNEAEKMARRELESLEKAFGPDDSRLARGLEGYSALLEKLGRKQEADEAKKRAAEVLTRALTKK